MKINAKVEVEVMDELGNQSLGLDTFSVRWMGGWEEKGRLKLASAKVEVEAVMGWSFLGATSLRKKCVNY